MQLANFFWQGNGEWGLDYTDSLEVELKPSELTGTWERPLKMWAFHGQCHEPCWRVEAEVRTAYINVAVCT